jgi:hypothetical protein
MKNCKTKTKDIPKDIQDWNDNQPCTAISGDGFDMLHFFPQAIKKRAQVCYFLPHNTHMINNVLQVENFNYLKEFAEVVPPPCFHTCVSKGKPKTYKDAPGMIAGEHQFINGWNPLGHPVSELMLNLLPYLMTIH